MKVLEQPLKTAKHKLACVLKNIQCRLVLRFRMLCVHSRIDYCNTVLAGAPRTVTDKLQHVLNAAARVISGTRKFDHGCRQLLHDELHWLDVSDRVFFNSQ